jgi:hypothetical protein
MVYSDIFNNVFEAWNLILDKICSRNPAAWQYRVLTWLAIGELYHIIWSSNAAPVDSSLQLIIFAQTVVMTSPFKLSPLCKTFSLAPFLKLIWARRQPVRCSSLQASMLCTTVAHVYSMFPSQLKRREKRWLSGLASLASLTSGKGPPAWRSGTTTLCQSRLHPPVGDREFGYCTKMSGKDRVHIGVE